MVTRYNDLRLREFLSFENGLMKDFKMKLSYIRPASLMNALQHSGPARVTDMPGKMGSYQVN